MDRQPPRDITLTITEIGCARKIACKMTAPELRALGGQLRNCCQRNGLTTRRCIRPRPSVGFFLRSTPPPFPCSSLPAPGSLHGRPGNTAVSAKRTGPGANGALSGRLFRPHQYCGKKDDIVRRISTIRPEFSGRRRSKIPQQSTLLSVSRC